MSPVASLLPHRDKGPGSIGFFAGVVYLNLPNECAGGTGFLLVLAYDHHLIEKNLDCRFLKINIDQVGSTIIYQD